MHAGGPVLVGTGVVGGALLVDDRDVSGEDGGGVVDVADAVGVADEVAVDDGAVDDGTGAAEVGADAVDPLGEPGGDVTGVEVVDPPGDVQAVAVRVTAATATSSARFNCRSADPSSTAGCSAGGWVRREAVPTSRATRWVR